MVQGVKFDPSDTSDIEVIAYKYRGNIAAISQHYNVSRQTIYEYFRAHPDGLNLINKIRNDNHESFLDQAEFVMQYALANYKSNLGLAMRAADKVIDKKGHSRGWKDKDVDLQVSQDAMDKFVDMMNRLEQRQSAFKAAETSNINESKS